MNLPSNNSSNSHDENIHPTESGFSVHAGNEGQEIDPQWWDQMRQLLEAETGMDLAGTRQSRLEHAVGRAARRGLPRLSTLLHDHAARARFVEQVTAELTIGESFFLRNENHMRVLREEILPHLIRENQARREIRIWSAGCAQGEEPYSLAILLDEVLERTQTWHTSILGTDLNPGFLEKGERGLYRRWSFRQTHIQEDLRYFEPVAEGYQIREFLRHQVRFAYLNLVKDVYPSALNGTLGLDLILFRNVAIYLKSEVTSAILSRFYRALRPGGWLLLGEIEVTLAPTAGFEVHRYPQATFYRKPLHTPGMEEALPGWELPVLTEVARQHELQSAPVATTQFAIPPLAVPTLPEWVPLPVPRKREPVSESEKSLTSSGPSPSSSAPFADGVSTIESLEKELRTVTSPALRAEIRVRLAKLLLQTGQTAQARIHLDHCLREDPLCLAGYLLNASLAEEQGQLEQAEHSYRRALYLDRGCVVAHFHLGMILRQQGDERQWRRTLRTVIELCGRHPPLELVEHGDGVCYGRFQEMALMLVGEAE